MFEDVVDSICFGGADLCLFVWPRRFQNFDVFRFRHFMFAGELRQLEFINLSFVCFVWPWFGLPWIWVLQHDSSQGFDFRIEEILLVYRRKLRSVANFRYFCFVHLPSETGRLVLRWRHLFLSKFQVWMHQLWVVESPDVWTFVYV